MKRILCVEDVTEMRTLMVRMLKSKGFEVAQANNGLEGFKKAKLWQPDLIITDLVMPYMDGYEAIMALRNDEQTADIPIVVVTASGHDSEKHKALALGADDALIKPFETEALDDTLRTLFGRATGHENSEPSSADESLNVNTTLLYAENMNLAYQLELWQKNAELASTVSHFTHISRDIIHNLRNRLGILQSYVHQARYCLQLLEALAFLQFKPCLSQNFFDGSYPVILTQDLSQFAPETIKLQIISRKGSSTSGIRAEGWLDVQILKLGLWLFVQGTTGQIPGPEGTNSSAQREHMVTIHDKYREGSQVGTHFIITPSVSMRKAVSSIDNSRDVLLGNPVALGLFILEKAILLHDGTISVQENGDVEIKIPANRSQIRNLIELQRSNDELTQKITAISESFQNIEACTEGLVGGIASAIARELANISADHKPDAPLIADERVQKLIKRNRRYAQLQLQSLFWLGITPKVRKEVADLTEVLYTVRETMKSEIREPLGPEPEDDDILVELNFQPDLPSVQADETDLQQVFLHIITNALEAMPEGGRLELKTYQQGNAVCAEIIDTGTGIAAENMSRMFDLTFTTNRKKTYGTGLYIAKLIVDQLDGNIEVESELTRGTTVRVCFPHHPNL